MINPEFIYPGFINEVKGALNRGSGSGGGLPFGENERENLFVHDPEAYADDQFVNHDTTFYLKDPSWINRHKSYDFVIRGDVYENISIKQVSCYYQHGVWGNYTFDGRYDTTTYPFGLIMVHPDDYPEGRWDENGNWIGTTEENYWAYPHVNVDLSVYPDLKPEEIEIYDASIPAITKISGKYVEGMGWSEGGGENLFKGGSVRNVYNDLCTMNLDTKTKANLNIFKSYDITIRGDVYKDVKPTKVDAQYWYVNWGSVADDWSDFPFSFCAIWGSPEDSDDWHTMGNEHCPWDIDGNWVGHIPPYSDHVESWMEPILTYRVDIYPDLKPEEIEIREVETIHPIDPKFLPNVTATISIAGDDSGENPPTMSLSGADFNSIKSALKNGQQVTVYCKYNGDNGVYIAMPVCYSDEYIGVYDYWHGSYYGILPDNTVVFD